MSLTTVGTLLSYAMTVNKAVKWDVVDKVVKGGDDVVKSDELQMKNGEIVKSDDVVKNGENVKSNENVKSDEVLMKSDETMMKADNETTQNSKSN